VSVSSRIAARRTRRTHRVRKSIRGTAEKPRITVHRTHLHVYAQMVDDDAGRTICEASSASLKMKYGGNVAAAKAVGEALGKKAREVGVQAACFDRGRFKYHGRIKALADAVRAAGVKF
jgi:large subunit ribosomal protein L18